MSLPVLEKSANVVHNLHTGRVVNPMHPSEDSRKQKFPILESNRNYMSFPSLQLGAKMLQFNIQRGIVPKQIILAMTLTGSATASVCAIPGYALIDQIQYQIGGSTRYNISGFTNFQTALSQLKTQEACAELVALAGGIGGLIPSATPLTVYAVLSLPFSRFNVAKSRFGPDTSIMDQPISIFISLKKNADIYTADTSITSLTAGTLQIVASEYLSSGDAVIPQDGKFLSFPCRYLQDYATSTFTPASASDVINVSLSSFRSGNLIGMVVTAVDNANFNGTNQFKLNTIADMQILFNGQKLFQSINESQQLTEMNSYFGATTKYTAYSKTNKPVYIKFVQSHPNSRDAAEGSQLGLMLGSQTITAQFRITDSTAAQALQVIFIYESLVVYNQKEAELIV